MNGRLTKSRGGRKPTIGPRRLFTARLLVAAPKGVEDLRAGEHAPGVRREKVQQRLLAHALDSRGMLWTVFGLVLLITFLFLVTEDYPPRNLIAVR
jgi:hypothetical protein